MTEGRSERQVLMFNGSPRTTGYTSKVLDRIKGDLDPYRGDG